MKVNKEHREDIKEFSRIFFLIALAWASIMGIIVVMIWLPILVSLGFIALVAVLGTLAYLYWPENHNETE